MEHSLDHFELPQSYGENRMMLMVRDPYCLFVYWDLAPGLRYVVSRHLGCDWEDVPLFLQLFEAGGREEELFHVGDFSVSSQARQWYLHNLLPDRDYCLCLAVRGPEGRFYRILQSNRVHTPWVQGRASEKRLALVSNGGMEEVRFFGYEKTGDLPGSGAERS